LRGAGDARIALLIAVAIKARKTIDILRQLPKSAPEALTPI